MPIRFIGVIGSLACTDGNCIEASKSPFHEKNKLSYLKNQIITLGKPYFKLMTPIQQNLTALNQELDWLSAVISQALTSYLLHEGHEQDWQNITLPVVSEESAFGNFVIKQQLDIYSRLALALAVAPQLKPQSLDIFFSKNQIYDRAFTEFGGKARHDHAGFLPTVQTLNFLITVKDLLLFEKVVELISSSHTLQQQEVILMPEAEIGFPKLSCLWGLNPKWFNYFITGNLG